MCCEVGRIDSSWNILELESHWYSKVDGKALESDKQGIYPFWESLWLLVEIDVGE